MKKIFTLLVCSFLSLQMYSQIVLNEVDMVNGIVELKNTGSSSVDVSSYWLCNFPSYDKISDLTVTSGSTTIPVGGFLVLSFNAIKKSDGELGLYSSSSFSSTSAIVDYIEWGSSDHVRSSVAINAGTWTTGNFLTAHADGESFEFDGEGNTASDYVIVTTPTFGSENSPATLSIVENHIESNISIYPNPVINTISFGVNIEKVIVYSSFGTIVKTKENTNHINLGDLSTGSYIIKLHTATGIETHKIIKK